MIRILACTALALTLFTTKSTQLLAKGDPGEKATPSSARATPELVIVKQEPGTSPTHRPKRKAMRTEPSPTKKQAVEHPPSEEETEFEDEPIKAPALPRDPEVQRCISSSRDRLIKIMASETLMALLNPVHDELFEGLLNIDQMEAHGFTVDGTIPGQFTHDGRDIPTPNPRPYTRRHEHFRPNELLQELYRTFRCTQNTLSQAPLSGGQKKKVMQTIICSNKMITSLREQRGYVCARTRARIVHYVTNIIFFIPESARKQVLSTMARWYILGNYDHFPPLWECFETTADRLISINHLLNYTQSEYGGKIPARLLESGHPAGLLGDETPSASVIGYIKHLREMKRKYRAFHNDAELELLSVAEILMQHAREACDWAFFGDCAEDLNKALLALGKYCGHINANSSAFKDILKRICVLSIHNSKRHHAAIVSPSIKEIYRIFTELKLSHANTILRKAYEPGYTIRQAIYDYHKHMEALVKEALETRSLKSSTSTALKATLSEIQEELSHLRN